MIKDTIYNTNPQNLNLQVFNFLKRYCECSEDVCLASLEILEPNLKYTKRNEKHETNMNRSIPKKTKAQIHYSHIKFSFLFLFVYFEFSSEFLGIVNTHLLNTDNFGSTFL
jgi:hypothetical protein